MRLDCAITALLLICAGGAACAQTVADTDTMGVSITIEDGCTLTANNLSFPTSSVIAGNIDAETTVLVTCTNGTDYEISADAGLNSVTHASRQMLAGAENVEYTIFTNSGRTTVWNETTGLLTGTGDGSQASHTVYGRVTGSQSTPSPATYSDTITVTVTIDP